MSRVFPTESERWPIKMSIGSKISRLSDHPARKLSIQQPKSRQQSTQVSSNQTFRYKRILGTFRIDFILVVVVPYN